jgi:hypothetical protein
VIPFSLKPYKEVGCHICNFYQDIKYRQDVLQQLEGGHAHAGAPAPAPAPAPQGGYYAQGQPGQYAMGPQGQQGYK